MIDKTLDELISYVCKYVRDDRRLNKLLGASEHTPENIEQAIEMALDDYNNVIPYSNYTLDNFRNYPSLQNLVHGAVIELLTSAGILQSRNRLAYSDGGVNVAVSDKAADYQGWLNRFVALYEKKKTYQKNAQNVAAGWGGVASPYIL